MSSAVTRMRSRSPSVRHRRASLVRTAHLRWIGLRSGKQSVADLKSSSRTTSSVAMVR